jgi:GT2 family glycosyltransferase
MGDSIDLTICIVNWNTAKLLRDCLDSIFNQKWRISLQVVVVDNHSADLSAAMVRSKFPNQVILIENKENLGFARANNQAFAQAQGEYVLILNSDTLVCPGSLDDMVDFMEHHSETGALGCKLINPDGSVQRSCWLGYPNLKAAIADAFYLWRLLPNLPWMRTCETAVANPKIELEVDHLLGACILVRRDVINAVGGMNEDLFLFLEETEWCYRIKKSGWKIHYLPHAQIVHIGQQSVNQQPALTLPEKYRNFIWFYRRTENPSEIQVAVLKLVIAFAAIIRIGLWSERSLSSAYREKAYRMRYGYWEVIRQLPSF